MLLGTRLSLRQRTTIVADWVDEYHEWEVFERNWHAQLQLVHAENIRSTALYAITDSDYIAAAVAAAMDIAEYERRG